MTDSERERLLLAHVKSHIPHQQGLRTVSQPLTSARTPGRRCSRSGVSRTDFDGDLEAKDDLSWEEETLWPTSTTPRRSPTTACSFRSDRSGMPRQRARGELRRLLQGRARLRSRLALPLAARAGLRRVRRLVQHEQAARGARRQPTGRARGSRRRPIRSHFLPLVKEGKHPTRSPRNPVRLRARGLSQKVSATLRFISDCDLPSAYDRNGGKCKGDRPAGCMHPRSRRASLLAHAY